MRSSIIERVFDFQPDLVFFLQGVLETIQLLCQQVVDLQLLLDHAFKLLNVGVNVVVDVTHTLDFGNELAFLSEKFGIFFDGCHVGGKNFFLLIENVCHFFLESKVLFFILTAFHGAFHGINIVFDLLFSFLLQVVFFSINLFHDLIIYRGLLFCN